MPHEAETAAVDKYVRYLDNASARLRSEIKQLTQALGGKRDVSAELQKLLDNIDDWVLPNVGTSQMVARAPQPGQAPHAPLGS